MAKNNVLNKQTVLQGTLTLTYAWLIIRILGAVYRIPLVRMLGSTGAGFYSAPNLIYLLFFTVSTAGIPVALASIVSKKIAIGHYREALRTFQVARSAMLIIGAVFALLLFEGAGWLIHSGLVSVHEAYWGIRAIAPVIFFAAITACYRGLFQGLQNMRAVAYSQVTEQVLLVGATLLFSFLLLPKGLVIAAAGANFGAVPGAVGATLMLLFIYRRQRSGFSELVEQDVSGVREGTLSLLKQVFTVAILVSLASIAMAITNLIDQWQIVNRLPLAGYTYVQSVSLFGQFSQMAMSLVNISISLALALGSNMVPAVAGAFAQGDLERVRRQLGQALRLAMVLAIPASAGLYLLAPQLTRLLFADSGAGAPLAALSAVVIFWSVHLVTAGALQGMGKAIIPVRSLVCGIVIKIAVTYYFTPIVGIRAASYGTVIVFIVASILNIMALRRLIGLRINFRELFAKSIPATLIMSVGVLVVFKVLELRMGDNNWSTLCTVVVGIVLYPAALLLLGGVRAEDVRRLPGGGRIAVFLERIGRA